MNKLRPSGLYWDGKSLAFGFWILQPSGKLYFSGTPVDGGKWSLAIPQDLTGLKYLCSLEGGSYEQKVVVRSN